jgi:hypothetical protein
MLLETRITYREQTLQHASSSGLRNPNELRSYFDRGGALIPAFPARVNGTLRNASFLRIPLSSRPCWASPPLATGKVVGKTVVWVQDDEDDDQPSDEEHTDADDNGEPQVDVIVASFGRDDPFALGGIRAGWVEWRFPRRVEFTWFARGSRGWSGTDVAITAFVLDEGGKIVGQGVGCIRSELRPEHTWSCAGAGGTPLVAKEGKYDVAFALNDRPIAMWPMEAMVRTASHSSALDKWLKELHQKRDVKKHAPKKPLPTAPAAPSLPRPKLAAPAAAPLL